MEMEKDAENTIKEPNENQVSIKTEMDQENIVSQNGNLGKDICNDHDMLENINEEINDLSIEFHIKTGLDQEKYDFHIAKLEKEIYNVQGMKKNAKTEKDLENERLETESFLKIVEAFKNYRTHYFEYFCKRIRYLKTLPQKQQNALTKYKICLERILKCVECNNRVISLIIEDCFMVFENERQNQMYPPPNLHVIVRDEDIDKVQIVIKQLYRDWTSEGKDERNLCYSPILRAIEKSFPTEQHKREDVKVLVPGAGLGRLAFEIVKRGFTCQGNEFSMYMLLASNFVLNKSKGVNCYEIYPWITNVDNNFTPSEQLKMVRFPDEDPSQLQNLHQENRFSMTAGDFLEVYTSHNEWDCVATCFFIDCAPNIYIFIEKIYEILKPGGTWINLGPLQYHFSQHTTQNSIEPSFDVVKEIIVSIGFKIQFEQTGLPTLYSQNIKSMLKQSYESTFLVCVKPV